MRNGRKWPLVVDYLHVQKNKFNLLSWYDVIDINKSNVNKKL